MPPSSSDARTTGIFCRIRRTEVVASQALGQPRCVARDAFRVEISDLTPVVEQVRSRQKASRTFAVGCAEWIFEIGERRGEHPNGQMPIWPQVVAIEPHGVGGPLRGVQGRYSGPLVVMSVTRPCRGQRHTRVSRSGPSDRVALRAEEARRRLCTDKRKPCRSAMTHKQCAPREVNALFNSGQAIGPLRRRDCAILQTAAFVSLPSASRDMATPDSSKPFEVWSPSAEARQGGFPSHCPSTPEEQAARLTAARRIRAPPACDSDGSTERQAGVAIAEQAHSRDRVQGAISIASGSERQPSGSRQFQQTHTR